MGILSNPKFRAHFTTYASKYSHLVCTLSYIVGVIWIISLAYEPFNAKVYFSENSLLPGLVTTEPHRVNDITTISNGLHAEVKRLNEVSATRYQIPDEYLVDYFRDEGLEVYTQNFTFTYPDNIRKGQKFKGRNVYAILRASRTASTEAIVLSAPYLPAKDRHDGIAMLMYLAKKFKRHNYWAKDLIFLISEHEMLGTSAWLNAYHYVHNEYIVASELVTRSGSIQAAVNLEVSNHHNHLNIKVEGINGQLPNLDLVNTAVQLADLNNIYSTVQYQSDHYRPESVAGYLRALTTMSSMTHTLASGQPTGCHAIFLRYNIESITLETFQHPTISGNRITLNRIASMVDSLSRSINNLMERFHQSFFFYLLAGTKRYISIGLYMPPVMIFAVVPVVIKALSLWITLSKQENRTSLGEDAVSIIPHLILCSLFGILANIAPSHFIGLAKQLRLSPGYGLFLGAMSLHVTVLITPFFLKRKLDTLKEQGFYSPNYILMKFIILILSALMFGALACLNVSLAICIAIVWTPVVVLLTRTSNPFMYAFFTTLTLLISPLSLLAIFHLIRSYTLDPTAAATTTTTDSPSHDIFTAIGDSLLSSLVAGAHHNVWTLPFVSGVLFPVWSLIWTMLNI